MSRRFILLLPLLGLAGCPPGTGRTATSASDEAQAEAEAEAEAGVSSASRVRRRYVVDAHVHVGPSEATRAIDIFDEVGIAFGLNLSGGWPGGGLERQIAVAEQTGRFIVACNLPWGQARIRETFPELAVKLLRVAKTRGARALKVEKALGLSVMGPDGHLLAVDDPWLSPIWEAAGELGLPVVIHTADPVAFWRPDDAHNERHDELEAHPGWSYHFAPVPSFEALTRQFENLVSGHPRTTFVGVHFGNHAEDPFRVGELLRRHPNLFVDIAARVPELGRHDAKRLRALFVNYQDRILFGTDLGVSRYGFLMLGSYGKTPNRREEVGAFFRTHYAWLETSDTLPSPTPIQGNWPIYGIDLPSEVLSKVYAENAIRLFGRPTDSPTEPTTRPSEPK
ncbi:MAG: amidohydrolase family protein [Deltaproteobacteria bacterium]|nr:amidohydrolase family protein [Deltaproteobacteria bacterium]